MSLAETVATSRPLGLGDTGWREAALALGLTATIVFAGEAFGAAVTDLAARLVPDFNLAFAKVASPAVIAVYQIALLWFVMGWWHGAADRRGALGLQAQPLRWWIWPAAIVGLYVLKVIVSIAVLFAAHGAVPIATGAPTADITPFGALMRSPAWPVMLLGGVLAAVLEELLYRGYLSRTLEASRLGFWGGTAVASIVWAALHVYYPLSMQVMLAVMGLALSWLRMRTGSILPGMAWHIVNNTVALVALRLMA